MGDGHASTETAINAQRDAEANLTRLQAEIDALQFLLADTGNPDEVPVADLLSVKDGMEDALAAYLADELGAPIDAGDHSYWRTLSTKSDLSPPEGSLPLANFIEGTSGLTATLAGVGVVDDAAQAESLQAGMRPGQALTTRNGGLWRWDGFVRKASGNDKSAERIRQRQRLDVLQEKALQAASDGAARQEAKADAEENLAKCRDYMATTRAEASFHAPRSTPSGIFQIYVNLWGLFVKNDQPNKNELKKIKGDQTIFQLKDRIKAKTIRPTVLIHFHLTAQN